MNKQTTNKRIINCGGAIQKHTQSGKRDKRIVVARDDGGIREGHRFEVFFFLFDIFWKVSIQCLQQMALRRCSERRVMVRAQCHGGQEKQPTAMLLVVRD